MLAQSIIPEPEIPKDFYKLIYDPKLALLGYNTVYFLSKFWERSQQGYLSKFFFFFWTIFFIFGRTGSSFLHMGFLLAAVSGDHFLVAMHGLLIAVASPTAECGLQDTIGFSSGGRWAQ